MDGQAQLDFSTEIKLGSNFDNFTTSGKVVKILDLVIFSSQESLSFHFSFKLGVTNTLLSSAGFTTAIQSGNETTQNSNTYLCIKFNLEWSGHGRTSQLVPVPMFYARFKDQHS